MYGEYRYRQLSRTDGRDRRRRASNRPLRPSACCSPRDTYASRRPARSTRVLNSYLIPSDGNVATNGYLVGHHLGPGYYWPTAPHFRRPIATKYLTIIALLY